jgi:hypothetical protein
LSKEEPCALNSSLEKYYLPVKLGGACGRHEAIVIAGAQGSICILPSTSTLHASLHYSGPWRLTCVDYVNEIPSSLSFKLSRRWWEAKE